MKLPMIQDVLRATLNHAVKTTPPADLFWLADGESDPSIQLRRQLNEHVERGRRELQAYTKQGEALRENLMAVFASNVVEEHHVSALGDFVETIEENARRDALDIRRRLQGLRKMSRQIERYEPSMRLFFLQVLKTVDDQGRAEIEERLDFALFLRALRATHAPRQVVAVVEEEDGPDAIDRVFRQLLATPA